MKVRYQADNDLRKAIVRGALRREPLMSFRSAQAARLDGVSDPDVLALAADEGRILVSHDFQTMPAHFRQFTQFRRSPGVLPIRQDLPIVQAVESLVPIWEASEPGEWSEPCVSRAEPGDNRGRLTSPKSPPSPGAPSLRATDSSSPDTLRAAATARESHPAANSLAGRIATPIPPPA